MSDVSDRWRATTAKGGERQREAEARYRAAIGKVLAVTQEAYLEASEPAPHPVWWKRLLRRPYRRAKSPEAFGEALHRIARERLR